MEVDVSSGGIVVCSAFSPMAHVILVVKDVNNFSMLTVISLGCDSAFTICSCPTLWDSVVFSAFKLE